jgi:hypothetical protein
MTIDVTPEQEKRWGRPPLEQSGPIRTAAGFFGASEGRADEHDGVSSGAAEDAVVAAVRIAYKVADAQLQRSARLAERLSKVGGGAADGGGDRRAGVAAAMTNGFSWLETAVAGHDSPLMRLMIVQCKLIESMLCATPEPPVSAPAVAKKDEPPLSTRRVRIFLKGEVKRPVILHRFEVANAALPETGVRFHNVEGTSAASLEASLTVADDGQPKLTITTDISAPPGRWKGAVCSQDDEQIGLIEIEL